MKIQSHVFIVWNSKFFGFNFTEKSLYFNEKHKRKSKKKSKYFFFTLIYRWFQHASTAINHGKEKLFLNIVANYEQRL